MSNRPIEVILLSGISSQGDAKMSRYIGPYVIASELESHGINTLVIDNFTDHPDFFNYLKNFLSEHILAIGISSTFLSPPIDQNHDWSKSKLPRSTVAERSMSSHLWFDSSEELLTWSAALRDLLLSHNPNAKLVLGGSKTALIWKHRSKSSNSPYKNFDFLVHGAAEKTFLDFILKLKSSQKIESIDKGSVQFLHPKPTDHCPTTRFSKFHAIQAGEALPIETSRGCLFNCKFCYYDKQFSQIKTSQKLRDEFLYNFENFGTTTYHFCDDCFNDNNKKVEQICETILSLPFPIEWISYARADMSIRNPHLMQLMMDSGCRGLWWGLETFNHKAGIAAGKGLDPEIIKKSLIDWRAKYRDQCLFQGSFIVGLPYETPTSQMETLKFVLDHDILDFVSFGVLGILDFDETLDSDLFEFDYSEYSRNPQKYGFTEVRFNPYYWKHETMDSAEANKLTKHCIDSWYKNRGMRAMTSMWTYPILRSLGFSKSEIFDMARIREQYRVWQEEIQTRRQMWDKNYFDLLLLRNLVDVTTIHHRRPVRSRGNRSACVSR